VFGDRGGEFARIIGWPAVFGGEEFGHHFCAHTRPFVPWNRPVAPQPRSRIEVGDPLGDLDPKRRDVVVIDLERRTQPGDKLIVAAGQVGPLQLLLPLRREGMKADAEQRLHLLRRYRIASI
jgi:hypothetical protein